jgi:hypothetical protein
MQEHWIHRVEPESFRRMVERAGLSHLMDRPEELREEVLRRLGLTHLRDDPEGMMRAVLGRLRDNWQRLEEARSETDRRVRGALRLSDN